VEYEKRSLSDQPLRRRSDVMKERKRNTADIPGKVSEPDDIELSDDECQDRTLVLKAVPRSWKEQLMADGVKEIRCNCCHRIKPLAGAQDFEEGWLCEDCVLEMMPEPKYGGQRGG
jgi:hypothetical protein